MSDMREKIIRRPSEVRGPGCKHVFECKFKARVPAFAGMTHLNESVRRTILIWGLGLGLVLMGFAMAKGDDKGLASQLVSTDPFKREMATVKLFEMDEQAQADFLPKVAEFLKSDDRAIKKNTIMALGKFGPPAIPHLAIVLEEKDSELKAMVLQIFRRWKEGAQPAAPDIIRLTYDDAYQIQLEAISTLGDLRGPPDIVVPHLVKLLKEDDVGVQTRSIDALAELGILAKDSVKPLMRILKNGGDPLKWRAARALGQMGPYAKKSIPLLIDHLTTKHPLVQKQAELALVELGPFSVPYLSKKLRGKNPALDQKILDVLESIGTYQAQNATQKYYEKYKK
jgi:HEAT repeat protein